MEQIETLIIGGGQAGLTMSHHLTKRGLSHLVLERGRVAERWRSERWDGMHFQTPNKIVELPDFPFPHSDPDGFATGEEIVDFLSSYSAFIEAPVRCGVEVTALRQQDNGVGFIAQTPNGSFKAENVVVATGAFQRPVIPSWSSDMPEMLQLHASRYHAPGQLPDGAVLVVGSGASGAQIAEELMWANRQVYLSVSKHRRAPRRYRGRDHIWWWVETGLDKTPAKNLVGGVSSALVHTGAYGGHTIDFRDFANQGMVLLGRVASVQNGVVSIEPDLLENLAHGDAGYHRFMDFVDEYIASQGLDFPGDPGARVTTPAPVSLTEPQLLLDLRAADITTVIWATGYGLDFGWIDVPVLDVQGKPIHDAGVTDVPGFYFLGLEFQSKLSSNFLFGVGDDARQLAEHLSHRVK